MEALLKLEDRPARARCFWRGRVASLLNGERPLGLYAASGPRYIGGWVLGALAPALARGLEVCWVDAGNSFAAHHLAREAKRLGADPRAVLSRVKLARPFTAFQLEAMVRDKLHALAGMPVVVAEPLALFTRPDAPPPADARRCFARVLAALGALPSVLVLEVEREAPGWRDYWRRLAGGCRATARLEAEGNGPGLRLMERNG